VASNRDIACSSPHRDIITLNPSFCEIIQALYKGCPCARLQGIREKWRYSSTHSSLGTWCGRISALRPDRFTIGYPLNRRVGGPPRHKL